VPEPTGEPPAADSTPVDLELDDVILAWGAILPELPVATRSAVQNAQPLRVDGDIVVFGVPPGIIEAAKPRFKKEADTIRAALADRLGRSVRFNLEPAEEFALGGQPSATGSAAAEATPSPVPGDESPEMADMADMDIDLSQSTDVPSGPPASVSLLQQQLGATVVEELPRDAGS
jgi:hypothetical protein